MQLEPRRLLTTIDLATLTAAQGTTIFGAESNDVSGFSVSNAGDVNGDGFDDLIIGANAADGSANLKDSAGESYVIFGGSSLPATIDLASLGTAGITIFGVDTSDQSGGSVSSAGDVNGDGFDDLIIGASLADGSGNSKADAGECYVVFGGASLPAIIDLATLGSAGITIFGVDAGDQSGRSVRSAGDVNGDGFDDVIVGAYRADGLGNPNTGSGASYVIFGGASLPATIDLAGLGSAGITISGIADGSVAQSGWSVSSAGDVNGDGFDDLIIGAPGADRVVSQYLRLGDAGNSYVIFGGASLPSTIDLAVLSAAGITITGVDAGDYSGRSVSSAGDVNGDGFDDLLIGAQSADASGNGKSGAGDSYVVFGGSSLPATIDLGNLGAAGITLFGADVYDFSGTSVSSAGDVNGDGFGDLIIGAPAGGAAANAKLTAGESYVIFGSSSLPTTIDLANPGSVGITIFGADAGDRSGRAVSSAGDVNGDGFGDLIVGASGGDAATNAKSRAGDSYVIFGGNGFTGSVTHLGTAAAETLTGNAAANVMNGAGGNDTLLGNGGADVVYGGQGDDSISISDLTFCRINGGHGSDTLRLEGSGLALNLTSLHDNRLLGIETIDITGSGNNTLTLNQLEVLNLSDDSNTLIVRRNTGDVVNMGSGWIQGADQVIGPDTFNTFTQGLARLLIQNTTIVLDGTPGVDAFVLTYSGSAPGGEVAVTISTDGGPVTSLGTVPMNVALTLNGQGGIDSVRILGTSGNDTITVTSSGLTVNGAGLLLSSIETTTLAGAAGNDIYTFDADAALGLFTLDEAAGGIDTIDFSLTTTVGVSLNLSSAVTQVVHSNLSLNLSSGGTFEKAIGGSGNDILTGNSLNNSFTGNAGNDTMTGGGGNDNYVFGPASAAEADIVAEGANQGSDTLSFESLTTAVTLNLSQNIIQAIHANRTLKLNAGSTFENIVGGSGNDVLTGNSLDNAFTGNAGNDTMTGGSGNDSYVFGPASAAEADVVAEGTNQGSDTLSFASLTTAVTLNLSQNIIQAIHANRTLKLNAGGTFENIIGGSGNDVLTGNSLDNSFTGNAGNDTMTGGSGNDTYVFSPASVAEADSVVEGTNQGSDTLSFASLTTAVTFNLNSSLVQAVHANRTLKLNAGGTFENIIGGAGNDVLTGNSLDNVFTGNAGNDTMTGGSGNDTYVFGPASSSEADTVAEGTNQGTDTLSFASLTTAVTVNLNSSLVQVVHTNRTLKLNSGSTFENIIGGSGDDVLTGNSLNNVLISSGGNDSLFGFAGRDLLVGGSGVDLLSGGIGDDILISGTVSYFNEATRTLNKSGIDALMAEWTGLNNYTTRISNLRNGTGLNGANVLDISTVLDDAAIDTLFGEADEDWFWLFGGDTAPDQSGGEQTN